MIGTSAISMPIFITLLFSISYKHSIFVSAYIIYKSLIMVDLGIKII